MNKFTIGNLIATLALAGSVFGYIIANAEDMSTLKAQVPHIKEQTDKIEEQQVKNDEILRRVEIQQSALVEILKRIEENTK